MTKTILLLTTPFRPNVGGVETHLDDLIREATPKRCRFLVLTYQPLVTRARGKAVEEGKGYVVYRIPWIRGNLFLILEKYPALEFFYLFPGLFFFGLLLLSLKGKEIGVIHAQGLAAGAVGVFLGKIFSKPVLISTHSIYHFPEKGLYPRFVRLLFKDCRKVLALSEQSKREIVKLGVPKKNISVFRYWVDQKKFKPADRAKAKKAVGLPKNKFACLFVGRLVEVKGVRELLKATKLTEEKAIFIIAGDGPLASEVQEFSKKNENIIFRGRINNEDLPLYYNAADVLIVPSTHEEGFGRVILEALSCGTPVIGSRRGAIPEAMNESVGVLIDVTPENIKSTIDNLIKTPKFLEGMSRAAVEFARKRYSKRNVDLILKHYGRR